MSVMSALIKWMLRRATRIFHFTIRGDGGHNRTDFMNQNALKVVSAAPIGEANVRPPFARC